MLPVEAAGVGAEMPEVPAADGGCPATGGGTEDGEGEGDPVGSGASALEELGCLAKGEEDAERCLGCSALRPR